MAPSSAPQLSVDAKRRQPWGLRWRASVFFITLVVGFGIWTDVFTYTLIIPVAPFQLEALGYDNVSGRTGFLLFAYSGGLALATIPAAQLSEAYNRRIPLLIAVFVLAGSQVMFMEAPKYWVMVFARVLQGVGGSMAWTLGLALVCDTANEKIIGRQLGLTMFGLSIGHLIGPPIGGAMYSRFGFRAPFILGLATTVFDFIGRLLLIERRDALQYGFDPAECAASDCENPARLGSAESATESTPHQIVENSTEKMPGGVTEIKETEKTSEPAVHVEVAVPTTQSLSLPKVIAKLVRSPRALVAFFGSMSYGLLYGTLEPTLPLRLNDVWGLGPSAVGLVYLASIVPTLFSSPLAGWYVDRNGVELVTFFSALSAFPFCFVLIIKYRLALFIVAFVAQTLFVTALVSPICAEFAAVSRNIPGVGYAHAYGAFNLAYAAGTTLGPVIGGQVYDHVKNGWTVICIVNAVTILLFLASSLFLGDKPLWKRFLKPKGGGNLGETAR